MHCLEFRVLCARISLTIKHTDQTVGMDDDNSEGEDGGNDGGDDDGNADGKGIDEHKRKTRQIRAEPSRE